MLATNLSASQKQLASRLLLLATLCFSSGAWAQENELEDVQAQIKKTLAQLEKKLESSERIQQEIKLAELNVARIATQLNSTNRALTKNRQAQGELNQTISQLEQQIEQQQGMLAGQIKSAYMAGNYDFAKMLFNQDDAGKLERMLTYFEYLSRARQQAIGDFRQNITALEQAKQALADKQQELEVLVARQSQQTQALSTQQQARERKLASLNQQIQTDTARVERLQQQEQDLLNAIAQAELRQRSRAIDGELVLQGLANLKGKLSRPTQGRMQSLFGKRRQGQVRWKGVVINTDAGTDVQVVSDGRVLYADWLKGFGLVTIVDHGEGYMTVYGRNQALLRQAGDQVLAGETIALVGASGGQPRPSLYFEIRHKGKALNPANWLARK